MLIEIAENQWVLASTVSEIRCYKRDYVERWVVIVETKDATFDVEFQSEEEARHRCLDLVAKINGDPNNG